MVSNIRHLNDELNILLSLGAKSTKVLNQIIDPTQAPSAKCIGFGCKAPILPSNNTVSKYTCGFSKLIAKAERAVPHQFTFSTWLIFKPEVPLIARIADPYAKYNSIAIPPHVNQGSKPGNNCCYSFAANTPIKIRAASQIMHTVAKTNRLAPAIHWLKIQIFCAPIAIIKLSPSTTPDKNDILKIHSIIQCLAGY